MDNGLHDTLPTTLEGFWELTRDAQSSATHLADERVRALEHMRLSELCSVLVHYRWYTSYFAGDLAILIYKLPPSSLRSLLGEILAEELGSGDHAKSHLALYDRFLVSIGIGADLLEGLVAPTNIATLEANRSLLLSSPYAFGVGLRGMGGECLCQVYLEALNHYLRRNKELCRCRPDWTFWDLHAGDVDREHREKTRNGIAQLATPAHIADLSQGYLKAERGWATFWDIAYRFPIPIPSAGPTPSDAVSVSGGDR